MVLFPTQIQLPQVVELLGHRPAGLKLDVVHRCSDRGKPAKRLPLRIILVATGAMGEARGMEMFRNLLTIPNAPGTGEINEPMLTHPAFALEHIISRGAASPEGFWYDQPRDEWVALLQGEAELRFESDESSLLHAGDCLVIPAHRRHRVERTSQDAVWLALHFQNAAWGKPL